MPGPGGPGGGPRGGGGGMHHGGGHMGGPGGPPPPPHHRGYGYGRPGCGGCLWGFILIIGISATGIVGIANLFL